MRGRTPANLREEAKTLTERMGYHWAENTNPELPFDGFMFCGHAVAAIRLTKVRYTPGDDCIIEKKYPELVDGIRSLPLPPFVIRELWLRTQNERAYRRFYILPETTIEIQENTGDGYRNPHYREAYWKKAPYRVEIPITRGHAPENDIQKTP